MNLKKVIACGMLLGLLTAVSFAQHQRTASGGTMPGARLPNTVHSGGVLGNPTYPSSVKAAPNTHTIGVQPNTTTSPTAKTVGPNVNTNPDHVTTPNAQDVGNRTAAGPVQ